ncbi:hypothetical protein AACH10_21515 [Ideonella sp. DXS22W]|uniref:DUF3108 domain-containing protein n=1 Tax=Pseudaquabacterium inlustre TaxID=2984192 RepID=A0ABU9CLZ7_9BURK
MTRRDHRFISVWRTCCHMAGVMAVAMTAGSGWCQPVVTGPDPAWVGRWSGESISENRGVMRWVVERREDGRYSLNRSVYGREGVVEQREEGRWSVRDDALTYEPASEGTPRHVWRTAPLVRGCMQLQAVDVASGKAMSPAWRVGECRVPGVWPLPERIQHRCVMDAPGMKTGTVDLQIVREANGEYHLLSDGERDPQVVDVRDYPMLRDFDVRQVMTMTNAGEGLLVLVQMNADKSPELRNALGFKPAQVRSVRAWVVSPPRPQRPMEFYSAGRFVLMQALDEEGRVLGGAAYTPFIMACPASP